MAKQNNLYGLDKFEVGPPGDGVMGTDLTNFDEVELNSVNLDGMTSSVTNISTYKNVNYLSVRDNETPATVTARLFGVTPEQMVMLAGGEVGADGLWEKPAHPESIFLSLNIEGEEINGKKGVIRFPYALVQARPQGTISNSGLPAVEVTFTANTPESAAGVKGSPVHYGAIDAAPEV